MFETVISLPSPLEVRVCTVILRSLASKVPFMLSKTQDSSSPPNLVTVARCTSYPGFFRFESLLPECADDPRDQLPPRHPPYPEVGDAAKRAPHEANLGLHSLVGQVEKLVVPKRLRDFRVVGQREYVEAEVREAGSLPGFEVRPHLGHAPLLLNLEPLLGSIVASVEDSVKEEDGGAEMRVSPQGTQL